MSHAQTQENKLRCKSMSLPQCQLDVIVNTQTNNFITELNNTQFSQQN